MISQNTKSLTCQKKIFMLKSFLNRYTKKRITEKDIIKKIYFQKTENEYKELTEKHMKEQA